MVRSWCVAFVDDPRQPRRWWDVLFCAHGFRHVEVWGWDADVGAWVVYSVFTDRTHITVLPDGEIANSVIGGICTVASAVLRWEVRPDAQPAGLFRLGMWCVPAVKHLLGVRSRALSPYGLYRDLLRQGAKSAVEYEEIARRGRIIAQPAGH